MIILAVCLCLLQKTRTDLNLHTVIVKEQRQGWRRDRGGKLRDYTDYRDKGVGEGDDCYGRQ